MHLASNAIQSKTGRRKGQLSLSIAFFGLSLIGLVSTGIWQLSQSRVQDTFAQQASFICDIPYAEYRTILVRNGANEQIFRNCGLPLISEETLETKIDLSGDRRPLLNALSRKSKAKVVCCRRLVVDVRESSCGESEAVFIQHSTIDPSQCSVESTTEGRMGYLSQYKSVLKAVPKGNQTHFSVSISGYLDASMMTIVHAEAKARFKLAMEKALASQEIAITKFVEDNWESNSR